MKIGKSISALGICSGGLDSILSALVLRYQGINVNWISFETPFFSSTKAQQASKKNNIPLRIHNITELYMKMLQDSNCKFGKNMNPCMDCHSLMFRLAGNVMSKYNFDFMFSGEVLGQRPMSQNKSSLRYVEKHSGYIGYILRPLSAQLLTETIPEKKKLVNRNLLLDISGRSRKRQIKLADKFGVYEYPSPGGGCLLTDKNYCKKLKDLFTHKNIITEKHLHLLRFGRHMRLNNKTKIIVGRNADENKKLIYYADLKQDFMIKTKKIPGPVTILLENDSKEMLSLAASICVGYSKAKPNELTEVCVNNNDYIKVYGISPYKNRLYLI